MKLFWSGGREAENGVVIVVAKHLIDKVTEVRRIGDRNMVVRIVIGMTIFSIVSVYAPQTGRPEQEKQDFYDTLDKVLDECVAVIVAGDFNGHVGSSKQEAESVHGGFGAGEKNADGTRILDFALAYNLRIANTWFKKPMSQLITNCSGPAKTQVECIMCRKKIAVAHNVKAITVGTQHKMVVADFATDSKLPRPPKSVPHMRTFKLKEPQYRARFQKLGDLTDTETWDDLKGRFEGEIKGSCRGNLWFLKREEEGNVVVEQRAGSSREGEEGHLEELDNNPLHREKGVLCGSTQSPEDCCKSGHESSSKQGM